MGGIYHQKRLTHTQVYRPKKNPARCVYRYSGEEKANAHSCYMASAGNNGHPHRDHPDRETAKWLDVDHVYDKLEQELSAAVNLISNIQE